MRVVINALYNREWKIGLWLTLCSFLIYFIYFHQVLLNANSIMSSGNGDTLKNYFTFAFHIKNDNSVLHFRGMNFPYGEHVVFTDCQPILTLLLKLLPFTHNYLVGTLHGLIFISFIFSPLVLYTVFRRLGIDKFVSFLSALSINLLSPQFSKINAGHFGLAYGCVIPLSILLCLNYAQKKNRRNAVWLFLFNLILFFQHPYLGMAASLFTLLSFIFLNLKPFNPRFFVGTLFTGIFPPVLFKIFMLVTDKHKNRTEEPYGSEALVENLDTLVAPDFGPFKTVMESIFKNKIVHFEGHTYLGFFVILVTVIFIIALPFLFHKARFNKITSAFFFASFILLLLSFGWLAKLFVGLHIKSPALMQFRAICRFAWYFYFVLPVFICITLYGTITQLSLRNRNFFHRLFATLFLIVNMVEAHAYFEKDSNIFWKTRNLLNKKQLTEAEKTLLAKIEAVKPQAIIPLPMFCIGSEVYDRPGSDNSLIPAVLYSYHANIPILSTWLSRTSISETENMLQLLNNYKKENPTKKLLNNRPFIVLRTTDALLPVEERLLPRVQMMGYNNNVTIGIIEQRDLLAPYKKLPELIAGLGTTQSREIVYIPSENRKPFLKANIKDNDLIYKLDSNLVDTGDYIVSLHYYYSRKTYHDLGCNLLITKRDSREFKWEHLIRMSTLSGFYQDFGVFEQKLHISKGTEYEFAIYGSEDMEYHLDNFLLRPQRVNVKVVTFKGDTAYNNFPD